MGLSLLDLPLPIKIVPASPLSDDELIAFSRANEPYRMEQNAAGEIIVMTPVGGESSSLEAYLAYALIAWNQASGSGIVFSSNGGFRLSDGSLLSPDASWVARSRWSALTPTQRRGFVPLCPEFVIELRSESDSAAELEEKMTQWMANGAELAWLIDPMRRIAIIYQPGRDPETLNNPEVLDGEGPVAGFRLKMERFWV